jgi:hypothetical protein
MGWTKERASTNLQQTDFQSVCHDDLSVLVARGLEMRDGDVGCRGCGRGLRGEVGA